MLNVVRWAIRTELHPATAPVLRIHCSREATRILSSATSAPSPVRATAATSLGRPSYACTAATASSWPAASARAWSPPRSRARWPPFCGRSAASSNHDLQADRTQRCTRAPSRRRPAQAPDRHTPLRIAGGRAPAGEPSGRTVWPTRSTPAGRPRQPRTNTRECGSQPAHQSLLTVVSAAPPPALRNAHTRRDSAVSAEAARSCPTGLTTNIREFAFLASASAYRWPRRTGAPRPLRPISSSARTC